MIAKNVERIQLGKATFVRKTLPRGPSAYKEVSITKLLQATPGVIRLYDVEKDSRNLYLWLEDCDRVEKIGDVKHYVGEALDILALVHERGVVHNDVKFDNFLRGSDGRIRLIDFGNSLFASEPKRAALRATPLYCAPEVLSSKNCEKSDVWSVGVMAYRLLSGAYPFQGDSMLEIFKKILTQPLDASRIEDAQAKDFVVGLLSRDVSVRPSARQARAFAWLSRRD